MPTSTPRRTAASSAALGAALLTLLLCALEKPTWGNPAPSAGDPALDDAVEAHDADAVLRRMRELAQAESKRAVREIPLAYARIEQLPFESMHQGDRFRVFRAAISALLRIRDARVIAPLARTVTQGKEWPSRFLALQVAAQHPGLDGVSLALRGLRDKAPQVVALAARLLGNSKDMQALDPLVRAMTRWENREHREAVHRGRKEVEAELGGRAWIACRDALHRFTGQSFHSADDYRNYVRAHREEIDPEKVDLDAVTKTGGETGVGLFGLDITGRNILFILDISGSMETSDPLTPEQLEKLNRPGRTTVGGKDELAEEMMLSRKRIRRAKKELVRVVESLPEDRRFNLIVYSNDATPWRPLLVPAEPGEKTGAVSFVKGLKAFGVTVTDDALRLGLEDPSVDTIYLITDGAPTHVGSRTRSLPPDSKELMARILEETAASNYLRGIRIFTLGFEGAEEDFLTRLAKGNEGTYTRIR